LERSTSLDEFAIIYLQNPTEIDEDTTIAVTFNEEHFRHITLFVVTMLITLQPMVRFTPQLQR
jgi:hypothetical protein